MSAEPFFYFEPFLKVRHLFAILSHFYECTTFLPFSAIFMSARPFSILSHVYECATFSPFLAIFTSAPQVFAI